MIFKKKKQPVETPKDNTDLDATDIKIESSVPDNSEPEDEPVEKKKLPLFSKVLLIIAAISAVF